MIVAKHPGTFPGDAENNSTDRWFGVPVECRTVLPPNYKTMFRLVISLHVRREKRSVAQVFSFCEEILLNIKLRKLSPFTGK
jgi:hypothetical protein